MKIQNIIGGFLLTSNLLIFYLSLSPWGNLIPSFKPYLGFHMIILMIVGGLMMDGNDANCVEKEQ